MKRTWLTEFGIEYAIPAAVLKLVTAGKLIDNSWKNDVCPSFALPNDHSNLVLWINHPDADMRELPNPRFLVTVMDEGQSSAIAYGGDAIEDALQAMGIRKNENTTHVRIGEKFAELLREALSADQFDAVRERNRTETSANVCHSHDFCDANMVMEAAFTACSLNTFTGEEMTESTCEVWNDAWSYAQRNYLIAADDEKLWYSGNYRTVEIQMTLEQAESGSHQGQCDDDILALSRVPEIQTQLDKIDPEELKKELKEYGAWDETQLSDHAQNLQRILWLACGNISDRITSPSR